jgi:hypothetical protein
MLRTLSKIGLLICALAAPAIAGAQALPTATAKGSLQVGFGATYASPDYGPLSIKGVTVFGNFDIGLHVGVEADFHYVSLITPTDIGQNTILAGPRIILPYHRFKVYGKVMGGYGDLVIQELQDNIGHPGGWYFVYAGGGGIEYQATSRITIRAIDIEAQKWPNYGNGLSPIVYTVGAAYHFR